MYYLLFHDSILGYVMYYLLFHDSILGSLDIFIVVS